MTDIDKFGTFTEKMWYSGKPLDHQTLTPTEIRSLSIMALGLSGETGEVVEHIKKYIRDDHIDLDALQKELGDQVYYWARICKFFGFEPSSVLNVNIAKLESRLNRGTLRGDGDNR